MEKFTVDLDKVLDEFEFNEEQAVRHALQHFKREDLPATKYQKPPFRPINIADADFGPCLETTMSYPTYEEDKYLNDSIRNSTENETVSKTQNGGENVSVNFVAEEEEAESGVVNSHGESAVNNNHSGDSEEEKLLVLKSENVIIKDLVSKNPEEEIVESVPSYNLNSFVNNVVNEAKETKETNVEERKVSKGDEVEEDSVTDRGSSYEVGEELGSESLDFGESHNELLGGDDSETSDSSLDDDGEEVDVPKLPELPEVSHVEASVDLRTPPSRLNATSGHDSDDKKNAGFLIDGHRDIVKVVEEVEPNIQSQPAEINKVEPSVHEEKKEGGNDKVENSERASQSLEPQVKESESCTIIHGERTEEESGVTKTAEKNITDVSIEREESEIKPIQFETQTDLTDEELQRYLEELEEEEEAEEKKKVESAKPDRPQTLNLKGTSKPEQVRSPGQTPLPRNIEGGDGLGVEEENQRNENGEESSEASRENMEATEELERLMGSSVASPSSEPPLTLGERRLGKVSPFWMPDHLASSCMECDSKFTVIKRRHHCRACGRILCSKCCGMRASLEYLQNQEQRVCETCFRTLAKVLIYELQNEVDMECSPRRRPNPNNPMEYCSTVPPPLQMSSSGSQSPPSVMVPVGVLKREGSSKVKETPKQVMFSDGIRPGGDLTELDGSEEPKNVFRKPSRSGKKTGTPPGNSPSIMLPPIDPASQSFIVEKGLPPIYVVNKGETTYEENWPQAKIIEKLKDPTLPPLQFAINRNLVACVKIVKLDCCMKETCWVICSKGMANVGQDEIVILLTLDGENDECLPKEILLQFQYIYLEAARGNTVNELGYWCVKQSSFLGSKQHGGFLFIRPTFQCLNHIELPPPPYLVGILIHRSEIPWARVFPFRLMLRLGAEFRYYPCPLVSVRFREPVYYEIGHTIINLLADFRNLSYTIPNVRGLKILMEANQTSILIPRNRYDQVVRALNNSNDPVLALAGSFSPEADAHLVCMQSKGNEVTYSTHAININDKPRKVTGASFVVLNGALKTTAGVAAKSSIVEDGLMVQVPSETMTTLRNKLRNMEDWSVCCGPIEGRNAEEVVKIIWCEDDKNFNVGVRSVIDNMALDGVPSIRVHSGKDYMGGSKFIRWTQVFIIKCEDGATSAKIGDPLEVNKLSESIARATCIALIKLLELLSASGLTVLAVRATMDKENVGYEAGSNGEKLAPIYMNSLDNELIPVLHKAASINDSVAVLELMFHIMDK